MYKDEWGRWWGGVKSKSESVIHFQTNREARCAGNASSQSAAPAAAVISFSYRILSNTEGLHTHMKIKIHHVWDGDSISTSHKASCKTYCCQSFGLRGHARAEQYCYLFPTLLLTRWLSKGQCGCSGLRRFTCSGEGLQAKRSEPAGSPRPLLACNRALNFACNA